MLVRNWWGGALISPRWCLCAQWHQQQQAPSVETLPWPAAQVPVEPIDYLEAAKEHRGKSEPLFLVYRVRHLAAPCVLPTGTACALACAGR